MISPEFLKDINAAYCRLETKQAQIASALFHRMFELESGWYNGHYHKNKDGTWNRDSFPIPVVSVKGLCDIEIQFDELSVSAKLKRDTALACSFDKIMDYHFEVYGVEDYLSDYYHTGQTVQELKDSILDSEEKEVGFSFIFPFETDGEQIFEFVKLLRREGFYY